MLRCSPERQAVLPEAPSRNVDTLKQRHDAARMFRESRKSGVIDDLACDEAEVACYLPERFRTAFVTASRTASWRMAH